MAYIFYGVDKDVVCYFKKPNRKTLTIFETFEGYSLTNGQQELLKNLNEFLEDRTSCFLLKGYAGTGKTFMMKGLTDFLKSVNRPFVLAAPTGRAAKVISQRTKSKAYTIHKTIYSNQDIKEFKTENTDGTETFKFEYSLRNNQDQANTVYIIDEASMLSDMYSEGEFFRFGSGFYSKIC
ncbi:MAG: AAA family ATPase [Saprospiraceae bacterium]|nr:AAA family ATPase [Saprospiraceae bacterium]